MAGETDVASAFELALIEVLSDAGCLERSLTVAAKEARNIGNREEAAALEKAIGELAEAAQDVAFAAMETAGITDVKHFAWANDPSGATTRELALARGAARSLQVHLERVAKFAEVEAPYQEEKKEAEAAKAKADADAAKVAEAIAKAKEAGAAAKAAKAPAASTAAPQTAPAASGAAKPAPPAKAAPAAAKK